MVSSVTAGRTKNKNASILSHNGHSMKTTTLPTSDKSQQAMVQAEMNSLQHAVHFTLRRCDKPCGNVPLGYQCFLCVHYHCQLTQTHTTDFPVIDFLLPESGTHYLSASAYLSHFLLSDVI